MGNFTNRCLVFLSILLLSSPAYSKAKTAFVFSGGGFQTAMFLGMLEGAESLGIHPDLIVSTCGGSLAAAIAKVYPTSKERRKFIESIEFHRFIASPEFTEYANMGSALKLLANVEYRRRFNDVLPDIFKTFLMDVRLDSSFQKMTMGFADKGLRNVMIAARVGFGPKNVEDQEVFGKRKLFQEVFFTDSETAVSLKGFQSPIAIHFSESAIQTETDVMVGYHLDEAARASISDPYLVNPMQIEGTYFITGAIDLYAIEVAHHLAEEVIMSFDEEFDPVIELPLYDDTFRYNNNERLRQVNDQYSTYWIDRSDSSILYKNFGLNPAPSGFNIVSRVPKDIRYFRSIIDEQWTWGKWRAIEALTRPKKNDKSHIRKMSQENASSRLREEYHR